MRPENKFSKQRISIATVWISLQKTQPLLTEWDGVAPRLVQETEDVQPGHLQVVMK